MGPLGQGAWVCVSFGPLKWSIEDGDAQQNCIATSFGYIDFIVQSMSGWNYPIYGGILVEFRIVQGPRASRYRCSVRFPCNQFISVPWLRECTQAEECWKFTFQPGNCPEGPGIEFFQSWGRFNRDWNGFGIETASLFFFNNIIEKNIGFNNIEKYWKNQ